MVTRAVLALALFALGVGPGLVGTTVLAQDATPAASGDPIVIGAAIHQTEWMAAYDLPPLEGAHRRPP